MWDLRAAAWVTFTRRTTASSRTPMPMKPFSWLAVARTMLGAVNAKKKLFHVLQPPGSYTGKLRLEWEPDSANAGPTSCVEARVFCPSPAKHQNGCFLVGSLHL